MVADSHRPKKRGRRSLAELRETRQEKDQKIELSKDGLDNLTLGNRIRILRNRLGLSQFELAKPEYVASYISAIERDKIRPSLKALQIIASRLGESVEFFLYGSYSTSSKTFSETTLDGSGNKQLRLIDNFSQAEMMIELMGYNSLYSGSEYSSQIEQFLHQLSLNPLDSSSYLLLQKLWAIFYYKCGELDKARSILEALFSDLDIEGQNGLKIEIFALIGWIYFQRRQLEQAAHYLTQALDISRANQEIADPALKLQVLSNLSSVYIAQGKQDDVLGCFLEALSLQQELGSQRHRSQLYLNLATKYREQENLEQSLHYSNLSLYFLREQLLRSQLLRLSAEIADLLVSLNRDSDAETLLTSELSMGYPDGTMEKADLSIALSLEAWLLMRQNNLEQASSLIDSSIKEAREANDRVAEARALKMAGELETRRDNREEAAHYFKTAITLLEELKMSSLLGDIYKAFGEALEKWGKYAEAVNYLKKAYESKR
jgi:tetratricopeptide (TPR) repeat protein